MGDKTRGLYNKFTVTRNDGSSEHGGKHHGCEYFVLDLTHDKHAPAAIEAYANSCEPEYPLLARDLRAKLGTQGRAEAVLPYAYLLHKLAMVLPLFQEARDALPSITQVQRRLHGISPTLADRMDAAGTFSLEDWEQLRQVSGPWAVQPPKFKMGDYVRKKSGSAWSGRVVGTYSTTLTPEGYAVESDAHPGSVQIYPAAALEPSPSNDGGA